MFKNMKIGKKIFVTVIIVEVMYCIGGIFAIFATDSINAQYSDTLNNYGFPQSNIGLFNAEFNNRSSIIKDIILEPDTQKRQSDSDELDKSSAKVNTYFTNMKSGIVSDKELSYYNNIKDNMAKYQTIGDQVVALAKQNKNAEAYSLLTQQAVPISNQVKSSTEALINEKTTVGHQLIADLSTQGSNSNVIMIVVFFIAVILSLLFTAATSRSISKPLVKMVKAAKKMALGDLNVQINADSKDEIGQLGVAFAESTASIKAYIDDITYFLGEVAHGNLNTEPSKLKYIGDYAAMEKAFFGIVVSLGGTLSEISKSSEQVSSGSEQVSNGAQALAQGATEQASSVEQLSATITEISTQINENAKNAASASENANNVSTEIEISSKHMDEMVIAMSQINDSSSQIGKIIKTIEDIAFQTNILALNAAVEAARAGTAGKGFAVVADEVRNLASKSAQAAKDTTSLIENSMKQVQSGSEIANETATSLLRVVDSAKAVSGTVHQISQASHQQADAINQVTLGVDQISSVIQTNSATAEESSAASEELSGQAQSLMELVKKFKLRG